MEASGVSLQVGCSIARSPCRRDLQSLRQGPDVVLVTLEDRQQTPSLILVVWMAQTWRKPGCFAVPIRPDGVQSFGGAAGAPAGSLKLAAQTPFSHRSAVCWCVLRHGFSHTIVSGPAFFRDDEPRADVVASHACASLELGGRKCSWPRRIVRVTKTEGEQSARSAGGERHSHLWGNEFHAPVERAAVIGAVGADRRQKSDAGGAQPRTGDPV
jgi:hypothetical protein